ncbi:MAG: DUF998 domain-containing protein [Haloechinothrix sp.]
MRDLETEQCGQEAAVAQRSSAAGMVALSVLAIIGAAHGALVVVYLGFRFSAELDPMAQAVSYYVYVDGARLRFTVALLEIAFAGVALTAGLVRAGVIGRVSALVLMNCWSAGIVLVALFPTDDDPRIMSFSGVVHQVAGASLFVTLPIAALLSLRGISELPEWRDLVGLLRWTSVATLVFALSYLIARLPDIAPTWVVAAWIGDLEVGGLAQRTLFACEAVLVLALAVRLLAVSRRDRLGGGDQ